LPSRRDYRDLRRTWKGDLLAGLTVGVVALPLALAFGVSSGVGAEAGLVTAIVAGFVAAVFGARTYRSPARRGRWWSCSRRSSCSTASPPSP